MDVMWICWLGCDLLYNSLLLMLLFTAYSLLKNVLPSCSFKWLLRRVPDISLVIFLDRRFLVILTVIPLSSTHFLLITPMALNWSLPNGATTSLSGWKSRGYTVSTTARIWLGCSLCFNEIVHGNRAKKLMAWNGIRTGDFYHQPSYPAFSWWWSLQPCLCWGRQSEATVPCIPWTVVAQPCVKLCVDLIWKI